MMSDAIPNSHQEENLAYSTASDDAHTILRYEVSWGAIFAGVVVALVVDGVLVPVVAVAPVVT